jgi:Methylase-associated X1
VADVIAGRAYARVYKTSRRANLHQYLVDAVGNSGGRLLYASGPNRAPVYLGVEAPGGERIGILSYPFTATYNLIKNRPTDEHRLQIRYGAEETWGEDHPIGKDLALVDTTLVLGVHLDADLFVGLDANLYDPLPMGISIEFKQANVDAAQGPNGWHVFERDNITGTRRPDPRARHGLETVVLFKPNRLLDFVRLERKASDLGLDPALRFAAAKDAAIPSSDNAPAVSSVHDLEKQFRMTPAEIMEMISNRSRLTVAVRGGVAEHHLNRVLDADPDVIEHKSLDVDGRHDFDVTLSNGRMLRVECKNASPKLYKNGDMKVEVQKTRATQGDPAGRLYRHDQFDVVAACLYAPTGHWRFAYRSTAFMERDTRYPDRLAPLQHITDEWASNLIELV